MQKNAALLVIDVQNDFCPGGALAVAQGDQVVAVINQYVERFVAAGQKIIATRDWHPAQTRHFKAFGGIWPVHCVQNTHGAEFHPGLKLGNTAAILSKGVLPDGDSYSGFDADDQAGAGLASLLRDAAIERLFVGGLATDYCVKQTVLDGLQRGFDVTVLTDAVRGVDLTPGDSIRALAEMQSAGARFLESVDQLAL